MGLIAGGWATGAAAALGVAFGPAAAAGLAWHAVLLEYLPFVALIFALFTVGGGIVVQGGPWGTPAGNTMLLAIGTVLASVMGTTGAAMVLIHPLLRANAHRTRKVHLVVFFILLVANVGGSLTPLGDPPLFLGFLQWRALLLAGPNLIAPMLVVAGLLLLAFWLLDRRLAAADPPAPERPAAAAARLAEYRAAGGVVVLTVLVQGLWQPGAGDAARPGHRRLSGWSAWRAARADRAGLAAADPAREPGGQHVLLGALRRGGEAVRRHLRLHGAVMAMLHQGAAGPLRLGWWS